MKINTQQLKRALGFVKNGVSKRAIFPVLSHIHLVTNNGVLFAESTDLNCFYKSKVCESKEEFNIMVPASEFAGFVSLSKEEEIDVKLNNEKFEMNVKSGKSKITLRTSSPDDFPKSDDGLELLEEIDTQEFFKSLKSVKFYSEDVAKSILCAINFISNGKEIVFAATDGYRLIVNKLEKPITSFVYNLPGDTITKIASLMMKEENEKTRILVGNNKIAFETSDVYVSTRMMDGKFPDYNKILPKSFSKSFFLDKDELIGVLKTSKELLDKQTNIVNFSFTENGLIVSGSNSSGKIESELDFKGFEEPFDISFNEGYLSNALAQIDSKSMWMKCNSNIQPVLLFDEDQSDETTIMLMPIKP